jgi:hypothetical protein
VNRRHTLHGINGHGYHPTKNCETINTQFNSLANNPQVSKLVLLTKFSKSSSIRRNQHKISCPEDLEKHSQTSKLKNFDTISLHVNVGTKCSIKLIATTVKTSAVKQDMNMTHQKDECYSYFAPE